MKCYDTQLLIKINEHDEVEKEIIPRVIGGLNDYDYSEWDDYKEEYQGYRDSLEEMEDNGIYTRDFI